jgi:hypothetical protein
MPWSAARDPTAREGTFSRGRGPVRLEAGRAGEPGTRPLWLGGRAVCSYSGDLRRLSMHYATIDFSPRSCLLYEVRDIRDAVVWRHPAYRRDG